MNRNKISLNQLTFRSTRFEMRAIKKSDYKKWQTAHLLTREKQNSFDLDRLKPKNINRVSFGGNVDRFALYRTKDLIYRYGIFDKKSGSLVGEVMIGLFQRFTVQTARVSYFVFNNHWRQGIAKEMLQAAVLFAFKKLKLHRLEAEIEPKNKASIGLVRSVGFRKEGLRKNAVYFNSRWNDHLIYAITTEDLGLKKCKPVIKM